MFYRGLHVINMQSVGCVCCVMMFLFLSLSFCSYLCLRRASFFIVLACRRLVLMVFPSAHGCDRQAQHKTHKEILHHEEKGPMYGRQAFHHGKGGVDVLCRQARLTIHLAHRCCRCGKHGVERAVVKKLKVKVLAKGKNHRRVDKGVNTIAIAPSERNVASKGIVAKSAQTPTDKDGGQKGKDVAKAAFWHIHDCQKTNEPQKA